MSTKRVIHLEFDDEDPSSDPVVGRATVEVLVDVTDEEKAVGAGRGRKVVKAIVSRADFSTLLGVVDLAPDAVLDAVPGDVGGVKKP